LTLAMSAFGGKADMAQIVTANDPKRTWLVKLIQPLVLGLVGEATRRPARSNHCARGARCDDVLATEVILALLF
jgi:hypothetical protein